MQDLEGHKTNMTCSINSNSKTGQKEDKGFNSKIKENMYDILSIDSNSDFCFENLKSEKNISLLFKNKFMELIQSKYVISYLYHILKKIESNVTEEEIKLYLINYINKSKIYMISMQQSIYFLSLLNGDIYINKKNIDNVNEHNYKGYFGGLCIELVHELVHVLIKWFKGRDYCLNNKFDNEKNNDNDSKILINNNINNIKNFGNINLEEFEKKINCY